MNIDYVIGSLQKWEQIRQNSPALLNYLNQGNCFKFTNHHYPESSNYRHAYPGIYEGKLKMFVIPSAYDNKLTKDIASYIEVCDVFYDPMPIYNPMHKNDRISFVTAERRVDRWDEDYTKWVPKKVATKEGIFQAFAIPSQDFETNIVKVRFGLQQDKGIENPENFNADMIVACDDGTKVYEDFSTPVPPYGKDTPASGFYLLSQA
ncbi:hypothetical protein GCM10007424_15610 [Flavobacterium suaedae]|uniref:Uncharacterized protein n=1 Tax=Flavobacterium suaedae TaxID=1767027 RepID=A0ABQ1JWU9_9FLAO|nr:hypothetical protein [Flavobacterium suaedae]GGB76481.1 hypothetical protein GCM10007424_15610 [Flavobacterium suaedae]